ncbi:hypothetical protein CHARACLAT_020314 [Characodon lateralis]|uniref:Neuritin 1-like a n=1 Tax=Characodon lateralis TaxID=208331 RepID=A0ABU7DT19_9TELE|nr:hypothetical protein [Characodon lateralis]
MCFHHFSPCKHFACTLRATQTKARCLLALLRSWDEFHDCANVAMAGCPEEAAAIWESLRQESKKMQFSGNLYDMCSNRNSHPADSISAHGSLNQEEINQESLKGCSDHPAGSLHLLQLLAPLILLLIWI